MQISSSGLPVSLASISITLGEQKPAWHLPMPALTRRLTPSRDTAPGFLLMAIAFVIMLVSGKKRRNNLAAVSAAPALYTGTMIFVVMNCLGLAVICSCLSVIAVKLKKKKLIILFVLCFFAMLAMGYLSSKDFEQAIMNWIAEFVNFTGQALLLAGICILHKAGLKDLEL